MKALIKLSNEEIAAILAPIDRELKRQGLICEELKEDILPKKEAKLSFVTREVFYEIPFPKHERRSYPIPSSLEVFGSRPHDLKHAHLIDIFKQDRFNEEVSPDLKLVAYLIIKRLTSDEDLKIFAPHIARGEFHKLQAKVHMEVEKTLPRHSRIFIVFFNLLTESQREAIRSYHFENEEDHSKREIAEKMGISVDALKDRLEGAYRKLEDHFMSLTPFRLQKPVYWKTLFHLPDTRDSGLFVKSSADEIGTGYRLEPVSKARTEVITPNPAEIRTPQPGWRSWKERQSKTLYWPSHDGIESPQLAHLPNAYTYKRSDDPKYSNHMKERQKLTQAELEFEDSVADTIKEAFERLGQATAKRKQRE